MRRLDTLGIRIVLTELAVVMLAVGGITVGVLVVGANVFQNVMLAGGMSKADVQSMWQQAIVEVFYWTVVMATALSVALGVYLAWRISRPLARVRHAARQLADGDYGARVLEEGPREVESVAESFNQMAETLEAQERQRGELVANFAHELRTPLTNLRGYLEAMRDGVMDPSPGIFESLREEVDRLERLSRSLDALGGDGSPPVHPVELDLTSVIRSATELSRPGFERAGLHLRLSVPPAGSVRVWAYPDHLSQVLANLLQNAQRYTPHGGVVTVSAIPEPRSVLVSVSNIGAEIPAADLPHVFERFYRVDKSRDRARGGAGIGLAIVKQLIEQAGGRVGAESGRGATRIWFRLPAG